ncbi:MAG: DUF4293 domain-containing protein [Bacteroidota bacterium]|nr:DUF4293 domain-containing protein [Bacteroidota bacterium]
MLQRVQSLYLAIAFILGILMFFFPFITYGFFSHKFELSVLGLHQLVGEPVLYKISTVPLIIISILVEIIFVVAIFLYKNRSLQMRMIRLNMLLNLLIFVAVSLYSTQVENGLGVELKNQATTAYSIGIVFPLINEVLLFLALRGVKKDDELVRSADRIR